MAKRSTTSFNVDYETSYPPSVLEEYDPIFRGRKRIDLPLPYNVAQGPLNTMTDAGGKSGPLKPIDIEAMDKVVLSAKDISAMDNIISSKGGEGGNYIPPGAVPGSPGTNPEAPSWAMPFAGQPQMGGREAASRLAGAAGMTATGGMAGPLGAAARIGVGAGTGAIRGGRDEAIKATLIQALLEGALPALGRGASMLPFVGRNFREMLPHRPAVSDTVKNYSHSPWFGQTQQLPGPQPSPILNPAGQPARFLPAPPPPATGPVSMTEHTVTQPARAYVPNLPPLLRALLGLGVNQATPLSPQNRQQIPLPE